MKRNIVLTLTLISLLQAYSQKVKQTNSDDFTPGWYAGINSGINLYIAEGNEFWNSHEGYIFSLKENGGFAGQAVMGYDLTPLWGFRGAIGFFQHRWPDILINKVIPFKAENLTGDVTLNLSNWWWRYNSNRVANLSVFGGLGLAHREKASFPNDMYAVVVRGGIQGDFRLTSTVDINLIAEGNFIDDNYNNYVTHNPFEMYAIFMLGVTYHWR